MFLFIFINKGLRDRILSFRGIVIGEISPDYGIPADFHQFRRIPSVTAYHNGFQPFFSDLAGNEGNLIVVIRDENKVGLLGSHLGDQGRKIDIVLLV